MFKLQNLFLFIIFQVVFYGTAGPLLLKWFLSRDLSIGAPFFNVILIPIFLSVCFFLLYQYFSKLKRLISKVIIGVSKLFSPLADLIGVRVGYLLFGFVLALNLLGAGDLIYFEILCGLLFFQFYTLFSLLHAARSAKREGQTQRLNWRENGWMRCAHQNKIEFAWTRSYQEPAAVGELQAQFPTAHPKKKRYSTRAWREKLLAALKLRPFQVKKNRLTISHIGVCIFILGVLLSNNNKTQLTQVLPQGSELTMAKEILCRLRSLDHLHGPTFHSICGNLLYDQAPRITLTSKNSSMFEGAHEFFTTFLPQNKQENFIKNFDFPHKNFLFTIFPERRFFSSIQETKSTTEVAIGTNLFTDLYVMIGTGNSKAGGWYTTIMEMPFLFCIWIAFLLVSAGGFRSLFRQLKKSKVHWN